MTTVHGHNDCKGSSTRPASADRREGERGSTLGGGDDADEAGDDAGVFFRDGKRGVGAIHGMQRGLFWMSSQSFDDVAAAVVGTPFAGELEEADGAVVDAGDSVKKAPGPGLDEGLHRGAHDLGDEGPSVGH